MRLITSALTVSLRCVEQFESAKNLKMKQVASVFGQARHDRYDVRRGHERRPWRH
jgi:hypothetical protein